MDSARLAGNLLFYIIAGSAFLSFSLSSFVVFFAAIMATASTARMMIIRRVQLSVSCIGSVMFSVRMKAMTAAAAGISPRSLTKVG